MPDEDVGAVADAGAVNVIYGSATGLTSAGNQLWTQNTAGIYDSVEAGDRFGSALASGDLDGDAFAELAVGVPDESVGAVAGAGVVHVIPGGATGLTSTGSQYWNQNSGGISDSVETGDAFGASLAIGQIDGATGEDVAIGVPGEDVGAIADAGSVNAIYGSASGLTSAGQQLWHQNSAGIADSAEAGDRFGTALALGNVNDDSNADLVVGVPAEAVGAVAGAGLVHVIPGTAAGLDDVGSQTWTQNSAGIADSVEAGDGFGAAVGG